MIDINKTHSHILITREDWLGKNGKNKLWDQKTNSLRLPAIPYRFPHTETNQNLKISQRHGADRDHYGNWYWISKNGNEIRFISAKNNKAKGKSEHFWSINDLNPICNKEKNNGNFRPKPHVQTPKSIDLQGLVVTQDHYLIVGVLDPPGLLIFDLYAGGPPAQLLWPEQIPFSPFDMTKRSGGGFYILDRENKQYWVLNEYFKVIADIDFQMEKQIRDETQPDFQPVSGPLREQPAKSFPTGITLEMTSPINATNPIAIEALPDNSVLILDNPPNATYSTLHRFLFGKRLGKPWNFKDIFKNIFKEGNVNQSLRGYDLAFIPISDQNFVKIRGTLFIVDLAGNQTYGFHLEADDNNISLDLEPKYYPMRLYSGKGLITIGQEVFYDIQDHWLKLMAMPRQRYQQKQEIITRIFDGKKQGCVWHRIFLDACIPSECKVVVKSRAAEKKESLLNKDWLPEPPFYLRSTGSEIPYYKLELHRQTLPESLGTWELLLQNPRARYVQLHITLMGNQRTTPLIKSLRIYYPRFSYVAEYLPDVYQECDAKVTDKYFFERFLANCEGIFTDIEGKIAQGQALFDIKTIPAQYLEWLAGWFGIMLNSNWEEWRKRLFLSHIIEIFNQRGTLIGLIRAIHLAIDPCVDEGIFQDHNIDQNFHPFSIRIIEGFLTRQVPGVIFGDPTDLGKPGLLTDIEADSWTPEQGADPINKKYRDFLKIQYKNLQDLNKAWKSKKDYKQFNNILFPPVKPNDPEESNIWYIFLNQKLDFTYSPVCRENQTDKIAFQKFLARRYQRIDQLNKAYNWQGSLSLDSFDQLELPAEDHLPKNGPPLADWIQFVSMVLPIKREAHFFSVLVPMDPNTSFEKQQHIIEHVDYVVKMEKPAHTHFEVKPYWALFRIGESRLGVDTQIGMGSRFFALMLGKHQLAKGYLSPSWHRQIPRQPVVGRDRVLKY